MCPATWLEHLRHLPFGIPSTFESRTPFWLLFFQSDSVLELCCPMWPPAATCGYSDLNYMNNSVPHHASNIWRIQRSHMPSGDHVGQLRYTMSPTSVQVLLDWIALENQIAENYYSIIGFVSSFTTSLYGHSTLKCNSSKKPSQHPPLRGKRLSGRELRAPV